MKNMSFVESFLVTLTSLFTELFATIGSAKSKVSHTFSKNSKVPIVRMFHESLKD